MGTDKNGKAGKTLVSIPPPPPPEDSLIYIQVPQLTLADLTKVGRIKITLNEEEISLISTCGNRVHATQARCPHAGGPLHLADIEDLSKTEGSGGQCIKCPWHSWKFKLDTGDCVSPPAGEGKRIQIYPVRIVGQEIRVGFERIAPEYFHEPSQF